MYTKADILMAIALLAALLIAAIVEMQAYNKYVAPVQSDYVWHGQTPNLVYGEIE